MSTRARKHSVTAPDASHPRSPHDETHNPARSTAGTTGTTTAMPGTQKSGSTLRASLRRLTAKTEGRNGALLLFLCAGFYRAVVLAADYLLAVITATVAIPSMGAWLHAQSGVSQGALTDAGTLAIWLVPFLFLVTLLAAGEIALMRGMWRWSTRRIERIQDSRAEGTAAGSKPAIRTNRRSRKNPKRST